METTEIQKVNSPTPAMLLEKAIEKGIDIDKLERLFDLNERWQKDQAKKAFNQAMAEWQEIKPEIKKVDKADVQTKTGGKFSYRYSNLSTIQKQVDHLISKLGLSYRWRQSTENGKIRITCILSHAEGHSEETWLEADPDNSGFKNSIQAIGSATEYLRRYTLKDALGLSTGEDDKDANDIEKKKDPGVTAPNKNQNVKESTVEDLHKEYMKIFNQYQEKFGEEKATPFHPDNWKTERGIREYKYAIKSLKGLLDGNN